MSAEADAQDVQGVQEGQNSTTAAPTVPTGRQVAGRLWRSGRVWLVVLGLLVLIGLLAVLRPVTIGQALHPDSDHPSGARAVAQVLREHGVQVIAVDNLQAATDELEARPDATLFFHDPAGLLPQEGLEELARSTDPSRLVLVEPDLQQLRALSPAVSGGPALTEDSPTLSPGADCSLAMAREAGQLSSSGTLYRGGTGCFPGSLETTVDPMAPSAVERQPESAHALVRSPEGTWVVGAPEVYANRTAGEPGHPVISLWTLGQSDSVIWYLPSLADVPLEGVASPADLLPDWLGPVLWWLAICAVLLMFWRGRRHGPLAIEPLPVIVPSSETAVGRARLYQSTGQWSAAAQTLHRATRGRLARQLRLGRDASTTAITAATAALLGRDPAPIGQLLDETTVSGTRDMVDRAAELSRLEEQVHAALLSELNPTPRTDSPERTP